MPQLPAAAQLARLIRAEIDVLDGVLAEVEELGLISAAQFDDLEERTSDAARGLRGAFRAVAPR